LILFTSSSQVIGWKDHLHNKLQCVKWDIKPYCVPAKLYRFVISSSWVNGQTDRRRMHIHSVIKKLYS